MAVDENQNAQNPTRTCGIEGSNAEGSEAANARAITSYARMAACAVDASTPLAPSPLVSDGTRNAESRDAIAIKCVVASSDNRFAAAVCVSRGGTMMASGSTPAAFCRVEKRVFVGALDVCSRQLGTRKYAGGLCLVEGPCLAGGCSSRLVPLPRPWPRLAGCGLGATIAAQQPTPASSHLGGSGAERKQAGKRSIDLEWARRWSMSLPLFVRHGEHGPLHRDALPHVRERLARPGERKDAMMLKLLMQGHARTPGRQVSRAVPRTWRRPAPSLLPTPAMPSEQDAQKQSYENTDEQHQLISITCEYRLESGHVCAPSQ